MPLSWRTPVTGRDAGGSGSVSISLTGFSVGDLMLVGIATQSGAGSCAGPAGWTEIHDLVGASAVLGAAYYKVKTVGDGATATFTLGAGGTTVGYVAVAAYDPAGLVVTAVTAAATTTDSGNTGISFPAIPAPGASGYLGLAFACARGQTANTHQVATNPTGWTKLAELVATLSPYVHPAIFAKEAIAPGGETPSGGAWNDNSYEANAVIGIKVGPAVTSPVADFTGTPTSGTEPLAVTFTDASTNTPTSWAWTFGDGGTSSSQNPSHTYTTAGTYTVTLVATNSAGSNTKTRTGYITVSDQPRPIRINTSQGWMDIADATSLVSGTGPPTTAVGATGGIYLDTASGNMYGPKAGGAWPGTPIGKLTVPGAMPNAHASTHQPGGTDAMAVDAAAATGSLRTLGTGAQQAAAGNDSRFTSLSRPAVSYGTSPPGSPADGDLWYLPADATAGVIWCFRYRSGSASAYKWEFVGGAPLGSVDAGDRSLNTGTATWYGFGPPSVAVLVPRAGDYDCDGIGRFYTNNAVRVRIGIEQPTNSPGLWADSNQADSRTVPTMNAINVPAAGATVSLLYYFESTPTSPFASNKRLRVRPIRVT